MSYQKNLAAISAINDHFRYYKSTESLYELDQWSGLPPAGAAYRQKMSAFIAENKANLYKTPEAAACYAYFKDVDLNGVEDYVERGLIRTFLTRYINSNKSPQELVNRYNLLRADTMNAWKEARAAKDYRIFEPWLKQVFELKKQIALGINPDQSAFDTLVGITDEGLKSDDVAREFDILKPGLIDLMNRIMASPIKADDSLGEKEEDPDTMATLGRRMAEVIGFDANHGSINHKVVHGFTSFMGPDDSRFSTQTSGKSHLIFTCLHETGHQMYATGGNERVKAANMWGGIEGSFHEANARFYENIIGRSRDFWNFCYPQLQETFDTYKSISKDDFYLSIHGVHPSLKRIEADEVTYCLHAILRFELEKDYFEGRLDVHDMADAWNDKYEKYLGIRPANDLEGVLQDMHWAGDYIGYFQSYALGNIYDGQIREAVRKAIPDLDADIAAGNFKRLNAWMKENIWQYGCCYTSSELMQKLTGKGLDGSAYVKYLTEKYSDIYKL